MLLTLLPLQSIHVRFFAFPPLYPGSVCVSAAHRVLWYVALFIRLRCIQGADAFLLDTLEFGPRHDHPPFADDLGNYGAASVLLVTGQVRRHCGSTKSQPPVLNCRSYGPRSIANPYTVIALAQGSRVGVAWATLTQTWHSGCHCGKMLELDGTVKAHSRAMAR